MSPTVLTDIVTNPTGCGVPASTGGGAEVLLHLEHHLCFMVPELLTLDLIDEMSAGRIDQHHI